MVAFQPLRRDFFRGKNLCSEAGYYIVGPSGPEKRAIPVRSRSEITATIWLGLEAVLFVVAAVTYLLLIRSRRDASITTSIPAPYCITYF